MSSDSSSSPSGKRASSSSSPSSSSSSSPSKRGKKEQADSTKQSSLPPICVMVNGLPGNMGKEVSAACMRRGYTMAPVALTGPGMPSHIKVSSKFGEKNAPEKPEDDPEAAAVELLSPDLSEDEIVSKLKQVKDSIEKEGKILVAIDFTHPTAVNKNAKVYNKINLPFVMGTTGGDREELTADTEKAKTWAIIAPNMCKQIVALQAALEWMCSSFPGAFGNYQLEVTESHQSGKADTSGTAKALVKSFNKLRGDDAQLFLESHIKKLRTEAEQLAFGVPKNALQGHAWHTYTLRSPDDTVLFEFKHNVCGRRTYAEGVADAATYLATKINENRRKGKRIFNMIDVLQAGAMQ